MKRLLLIGLPLLILAGGVAGGLYFLGIGPFKKHVKKPAGAVARTAPNPAAGAARSVAPVASASAAAPSAVRTPPARSRKAPDVSASLDSQEEEEAKITRLSSVYEQMPAEETGRIFARLPDPLVEKLLRKMDERQVGKVLLALDTNRAVRLTQALAK